MAKVLKFKKRAVRSAGMFMHIFACILYIKDVFVSLGGTGNINL